METESEASIWRHGKASRTDDIEEKLEKRLGCLHARQRLGIEMDHEPQVFGQGLNFFHIENLLFTHTLIEGVLRLSGFYWQGRRNAAKLRLRHNQIVSSRGPKAFDGFKIPHPGDLHADMSQPAITWASWTFFQAWSTTSVSSPATIGGRHMDRSVSPLPISWLHDDLKGAVYGVLGNHDTIRMVPTWRGWGHACQSDPAIKMRENSSENLLGDHRGAAC